MKWLKKLFGINTEQSVKAAIVSTSTPAHQPPPSKPVEKVPKKLKQNQVIIEFSDPPTGCGHWYIISSSERIYEVDLDHVTCNCPDFKKGRANYGKNELSRFCKHLFLFGSDFGFCRTTNYPNNDLLQFYLDQAVKNEYSFGHEFYFAKVEGNDVFVSNKPRSEWINITTRKKAKGNTEAFTGEIGSFGCNVIENRWSYGNRPPNAIKNRQYLKTIRSKVSSDHPIPDASVDFSFANFANLPKSLLLTQTLMETVFRASYDETDPKLIKKGLLKIQNSGSEFNVTRISNVWLKHGEHILDKDPLEAKSFFTESLSVKSNPQARRYIEEIEGNLFEANPDIEIESINEKSINKQAEKVKKLRNSDSAILDAEKERAVFYQLPDSKEKDLALSVLDMETPDWYDREKGHTHLGYAYADLVRELAYSSPIDEQLINQLTVIDYLATLAILDGTISNNVTSQMYKIKADIAIKNESKLDAINYLQQAIGYNKHLTVKTLIKNLQQEIRDRS